MADEKGPPYLIDADTLARWLIIQCGGVREARKAVTRNRDAARSRRRPKVPPHMVCALAEQIRKTKISYRGGPVAMRTAIEDAAEWFFKNDKVDIRRRRNVAAAIQAARRFIKNGHWPSRTK